MSSVLWGLNQTVPLAQRQEKALVEEGDMVLDEEGGGTVEMEVGWGGAVAREVERLRELARQLVVPALPLAGVCTGPAYLLIHYICTGARKLNFGQKPPTAPRRPLPPPPD